VGWRNGRIGGDSLAKSQCLQAGFRPPERGGGVIVYFAAKRCVCPQVVCKEGCVSFLANPARKAPLEKSLRGTWAGVKGPEAFWVSSQKKEKKKTLGGSGVAKNSRGGPLSKGEG